MIYKHVIYRFHPIDFVRLMILSDDDFVQSIQWTLLLIIRLVPSNPIDSNRFQSIQSYHQIDSIQDQFYPIRESCALPIFSLLKVFYKDDLTRSYRWQFRTRCSIYRFHPIDFIQDQFYPIRESCALPIFSLLKMFYKDALTRSDRPIRSIHVSISSNRCCQVSNRINAPISLIQSYQFVTVVTDRRR